MWRAFYRLTGIEYQLKAYVEDVVRSELPQKTLDEAYETKDAVAVAVRTRLQTDMKWFVKTTPACSCCACGKLSFPRRRR